MWRHDMYDTDLREPLLMRKKRGDVRGALNRIRSRAKRKTTPLQEIQAALRPIFAKPFSLAPIFGREPIADEKRAAINENLPAIEMLTPAQIRKVVDMWVEHLPIEGDAGPAYFLFTHTIALLHVPSCYPKTQLVVAQYGLQKLKSSSPEGIYSRMPDELFFLGMDELLNNYPTLGRVGRRRFNSPKNNVTNEALEKIRSGLFRDHDDLRRVDYDMDYYEPLLARLNKFDPVVIRRCLEGQEWAVVDKTILYDRIQAKFPDFDFSQYPNIQIAMAEMRTKQFEKVIDSTFFAVRNFNELLGAELRDRQPEHHVQLLQDLIRRLVFKRESSRLPHLKDKYEDMLESCLISLMMISDPQKGLEIDPELLKKCLGIINNYSFERNRKKFFAKVNPRDGSTMRRFVRGVVPNCGGFPKLQEFATRCTVEEINHFTEPTLAAEIKSGHSAVQELLLQTVEGNEFYDLTAYRLVANHDADLDKKDDSGVSFFILALYGLGHIQLEPPVDPDPRMWNFYLDHTKNVNEILSAVVETFISYVNQINLVPGVDRRDVPAYVVQGCYHAARDLIEKHNAVLTEEMREKFLRVEISEPYKKGMRDILSSAQRKDKEDAHEVPVARVVSAVPASSVVRVTPVTSVAPAAPLQHMSRINSGRYAPQLTIMLRDKKSGPLEIIELAKKCGLALADLPAFDLFKLCGIPHLPKDLEEFLRKDIKNAGRYLDAKSMGRTAHVSACMALSEKDHEAFEAFSSALVDGDRDFFRDGIIRVSPEAKALWLDAIQTDRVVTVKIFMGLSIDPNTYVTEGRMPAIHEAVECGSVNVVNAMVNPPENYKGTKCNLTTEVNGVFLLPRARAKGNQDIVDILEKKILEMFQWSVLCFQNYTVDINPWIQNLGPALRRLPQDELAELSKYQLSEASRKIVGALVPSVAPAAKAAPVVVPLAPAVEEKPKATFEEAKGLMYAGLYEQSDEILFELDETEKEKFQEMVREGMAHNFYLNAASEGHAGFVSAWIQIGNADVNQGSLSPAIFGAVYYRHENVVRELLRLGANVMLQNDQGTYLIDYARRFSALEIVALIEEALPEEGLLQDLGQLLRVHSVDSGKVNQHIKKLGGAVTKLPQEVKELFCSTVVELDSEAEDIFIKNGLGALLILNRCRRNRINEISALLDRGVNIDDEKALGVSPLIWGVGQGFMKVVEPLMVAGATVTDKVYAHAAESPQRLMLYFLREKNLFDVQFMFLCDQLSSENPSFEQIAQISNLEDKKQHLTEKQKGVLTKNAAKIAQQNNQAVDEMLAGVFAISVQPKVENRAAVVGAMVERDKQAKRRNSLSDLKAAVNEDSEDKPVVRPRAGSAGK
jgi:ankyrin repeat protein